MAVGHSQTLAGPPRTDSAFGAECAWAVHHRWWRRVTGSASGSGRRSAGADTSAGTVQAAWWGSRCWQRPAGLAGLKYGLIRLGSRVSAKPHLSQSGQFTDGGEPRW